MALMKTRTPGAFSAGASVSSRICSASSIRPSPIETRPISLMRERAPLRKATRPMMNRTGASADDIERQDLDDQRGADIGAEHDRQRRHQADQAFGGERTGDQGGRGTALQQRGQADAGREGGEAVLQRLRQQQAQIGAERAQDAAVDHMQAPQQQCHAAHQVEKNQASHEFPLPDLSSKDQATAKRRRINLFVRRTLRDKCGADVLALNAAEASGACPCRSAADRPSRLDNPTANSLDLSSRFMPKIFSFSPEAPNQNYITFIPPRQEGRSRSS